MILRFENLTPSDRSHLPHCNHIESTHPLSAHSNRDYSMQLQSMKLLPLSDRPMHRARPLSLSSTTLIRVLLQTRQKRRHYNGQTLSMNRVPYRWRMPLLPDQLPLREASRLLNRERRVFYNRHLYIWFRRSQRRNLVRMTKSPLPPDRPYRRHSRRSLFCPHR